MQDMARPADLIVDETALDGSSIDVCARIGWLLRISRQVAGVPLGVVAEHVRELTGRSVSVAALSRLERSGVRNGQLIDAYEQALGLRPARLRAPIDLLCRAYPYAPPDESPSLPGPSTLRRFDEAVAAVEAANPSGGDWMRFARLHEEREPFGLPSRDMMPLLERLAAEMGRSVGEGFVGRMEALKRLRVSPYDDLVEQLARSTAADPERQVHTDLASVLAERPTRSVLQWTAEQLSSDSFLAVRGAAIAIERMSMVGGLRAQDWLSITEHLVAAVRRTVDDPYRHAALASALHAIPAPQRTEILDRLDVPVPFPRIPDAWMPSRRNTHYRYAEQLASAACQQLDLPEQPMLTRLVFELLYDFRSTRVLTAGFVLLASPFTEVCHAAVEEATLRAPDPTTRAGALSVCATMPMAWEGLDLTAWLAADDPSVSGSALVMAGQAGQHLPAEVLEKALESRLLRDRATYSAGMSQHPLLQSWASDPSRPARLRKAAEWWLAGGGRIRH